MKSSGRCPKCGSTNIIKDASAVDQNGIHEYELKVATYVDPTALIFKGKMGSSLLSAWVCMECGFTELYADTPKALRQS